jgi:hypothetical protein
MKRCPECQFLYENESMLCDMDGTPLRYTIALPSLPGLAKSIWDRWTIALLAAVILSAVLITMYRATPSAYTSSLPASGRAAHQELPAPNQTAQPAETAKPSDSSAGQADSGVKTSNAANSSDDANGGRDPFQPPSTDAGKLQRSPRSSPLAGENQSSPAKLLHIEAAAASVTSSTASQPSIPASAATEKSADKTPAQPPSSSAATNSVNPKPAVDNTNKPATQNHKTDSGVKSFFKKAGKVLKKPFGDN